MPKQCWTGGRSGNRGSEGPGRTTTSHFDEVRVMNKIGIKIVPSILLAATAALVVACGGGGSGMFGPRTRMGRAPGTATRPRTRVGSGCGNGGHSPTTGATVRKNTQGVAPYERHVWQ